MPAFTTISAVLQCFSNMNFYYIRSSSFFPKKDHRIIIANIYFVFAYVLGRGCSKCFPYKDSFNLSYILEQVLLSIPVLQIRELRYRGISKTCSRLHHNEETEAGLELGQSASSSYCFHGWTIAYIHESCLPSAHVREAGETHLLRSHEIRKQLNHLICSCILGQPLKCNVSFYVPGFSVWILCLRRLMNVWKLVLIVFMCPCVLLWCELGGRLLVGFLHITRGGSLTCFWQNSSCAGPPQP